MTWRMSSEQVALVQPCGPTFALFAALHLHWLQVLEALHGQRTSAPFRAPDLITCPTTS
jgi:hypothetical protein